MAEQVTLPGTGTPLSPDMEILRRASHALAMPKGQMPGADDGLPEPAARGPIHMSDEELNDMADALWRIRDLSQAGRVILGHAPIMVERQGDAAIEGLWGIFACLDRLASAAVKPIERNM